MKINPITLLIAFAIAALAGYGFYAANSGEVYPLVISIGGGLSLFITLAGTIALGAKEDGRSTVNLRVLSGLFFFVILIEQVVFSFAPFRIAPYIIITGVILFVYALITYVLYSANK